jgi:hypothetical protein
MKKLLILLSVLLFGAALLAQPHPVYIAVWDCDDAAPADITFNAWITARPGEVVTEATFGWGYGGILAGYLDGNVANGFSSWAAGEILHVEITNVGGPGTAVNDFTLTTAGYDGYLNPGALEMALGPDCTPSGDFQWPDGTDGTVDVGTPSAPGTGQGTGLPNEELLGHELNVGYYFTLDLSVEADVEICIDLGSLGYQPYDMAYWHNAQWNYVDAPLMWDLSGPPMGCVTVHIDASRASIPIVFANGPDPEDSLPVELTNFAAAYEQGEFVTVSWTTESETEMSYYRVYRDGVEIETVEALNEMSTHVYEITDTPEFNGTYYYSLEAVSNDGATGFWYTSVDYTVPVVEIIEITSLRSNYPNPFNPSTTIELSVKEGETGTLTIFNAKGQIIETKTFNSDNHVYTWDATNFGSGIYFYKLKTDSFSEVKKMLMLK